ncbi:O-methyltransferase [Candidatus Deianiraea vastatrix]|uniref:Methyltransferase n=1 Tax=Candidatus Deianiraea vastatrix TaxID=2163644 RepID=A0A5B8XDJ6_9RICK|nr:hypothetical protein [Candidatus Deianiraea vastatrix]QED22955.1 Putative methyltransferase [Candidatus Deianiraea vastatrix]
MEFDYQKITAPNFVKKIDKTGKDLLDFVGWNFAHETGILIDDEKDIMPWYNYTVVKFLKSRLAKNMSVFEYGSGFSTIFYAKRVNSLISVEVLPDCISWVQNACSQLGISGNEIHLKTDDQFASSILEFDKLFDLIIVDSVKRNECVMQAVSKLSPSGIVILDNSERENYRKSFDFMKNSGFSELTLTGIKPLSTKLSSTTFFYKSGNCFGI